MTTRHFAGLFLLFVLIMVYAWFDRERTIECRMQAISNGSDTVSAVKFCKN